MQYISHSHIPVTTVGIALKKYVITVMIIYRTFGCQLVNNLLDGRQQCALKEPGVDTGDCLGTPNAAVID